MNSRCSAHSVAAVEALRQEVATFYVLKACPVSARAVADIDRTTGNDFVRLAAWMITYAETSTLLELVVD